MLTIRKPFSIEENDFIDYCILAGNSWGFVCFYSDAFNRCRLSPGITAPVTAATENAWDCFGDVDQVKMSPQLTFWQIPTLLYLLSDTPTNLHGLLRCLCMYVCVCVILILPGLLHYYLNIGSPIDCSGSPLRPASIDEDFGVTPATRHTKEHLWQSVSGGVSAFRKINGSAAATTKATVIWPTTVCS